MSTQIRLASGFITAFALLDDSATLVNNFPIQTDQQTAYKWLARQPDKALQAVFNDGFEDASGKTVTKLMSIIEFDVLTIDMRQYIRDTIMGGKQSARVTMFLAHAENGFGAYQGVLKSPFSSNSDLNYERFDNDQYNNVQYRFFKGVEVTQKAWGAIDGSAWSWIDGTAIGKVTQT